MAKAPADDTPRQQRAGDHSPPLQELDQLHGLAAIWYKLGLQLGVRADDLEIIEKNYPRDADMCKIKMFAKWKRSDINPTYEKLVGALTAAGKRKLAESVCSTQGISLSVLDGTDAMNINQSHDSTVKSDRAEEAVIPSTDKEEMESNAVAAAKKKIGYLRDEYEQLVMKTQEAVKAKSPTLTEFRTKITLQLPDSIRSEVEHSLTKKLQVICDAKSIDAIFCIFNLSIWSYLNFGLLQHIVEVYGDVKLQQRIESYSASVESFRQQTTLKVFWEAYPDRRKCPEIPTELRDSLKRITFKHGNLDPTSTTLNDIESYRQKLAKEYAFPEFTIILADIEKGCVATTWLVPPSLAANLEDSFLEQHNILELKIQESTVYHSEAAPAADGATSVPEISFSDLEFGDQLGEGAFAAVYRGHWKSGDMDVAIKRVPGKINKTEIEILNLKHPCIIQCHGVVVDSPGPPEHYIITELAEGGSLYDLLYKKNYHPSPEESLQWAREIAQGMKYLHQKKMLHRDLKSSNVLLTGEGNIKICDFGGAKYFDHTTKQTLIGTYRWMAPEVMMGEPVSLSSDVFSYGMLLYEIFTGKLPFTDAKTDMMAINKIINGEVPAIPASMESYLAKTLKQCWSANPKDRPSFYDILEILTKKVYDVTPPPSRQAMAQATPLLPQVVDRKRPQITDPADHKSPTRTPSEMNEAREQERRFTDQLDSLQTEITRLRLSGQKPQPTPLHPQAKITWEPCSDLPVKMHGAQTVVIKDKVYCGGGIAHDASDKLRVFCYSPAINAWDTLPSCDMRYFGLSHWRGKLVTVGGIKSDGTVTNEVYEFDEATHTWKQSISPMPTARHSPAVLSHHSALTVAGGFTEDRTSVVEVFTEETSQWHTTEPLPFDWITPSTLLIDNRWYLLGGGAEQEIYSNQAVCIHIDLLLQKALPCDQASTESQGDSKAWETLPNTPVYGPAAATFGDSLLAVGGTTTNEMLQGVSAVYVYFPSPKAWIHISKLPVPLVGATTAMLSPTEPLVIGGWDIGSGSQSSVYKGLLRNE